MELSKEQQKLIERYKKMPSFLQSANFDKVYGKISTDENIPSYEYASIMFNSSSEKVKLKFFDSFIRRFGYYNDELVTFFKSLSEQQQESISGKMNNDCLYSFMGNLTADQQEKNFDRFFEEAKYHKFNGIKELNLEVRRTHKGQILSNIDDENKSEIIVALWDVFSQEEKNTYYQSLLRENSNEYLYKWKDLDEETKKKNIKLVLDKYPDKSSRNRIGGYSFQEEVWNYLSDDMKKEYFGEALKKSGVEILKDTSDEIQNSDGVRNIIKSFDEKEKLNCFYLLNSEFQIELFENCEDSAEKIDLLYKLRPETWDKNLKKIFDFAKQEDGNVILRIILQCPEDVLEKNSNVLGFYFSSEYLQRNVFAPERQRDLIEATKCLNAENIKGIIDAFYEKGLDKLKRFISDEEKFIWGKEERLLLDEMYLNIDSEKQKEIYKEFIDEERYDRVNKIYNFMNFENIDEAKEFIVMYFEKFKPEKIQDTIDIFEKLYEKNNTLSKTVNFEFLSSDIVDKLTEEQLLRITLYPEVQEELVNNKENIGIVNTITKVMETDENWTIATDLIIKNIHSKEYNKLLLNIKDGDLDEKSYENLCVILSKKNYFGIETKDDIDKYFDSDGKRNKMLLAIMNEEKVELPISLRILSKEELRKFAVSEYLFGMDLEEVNNYGIRYQGIKDIDVEGSEYIKNLLNKVTVLNNANPKQIDQIIDKIKEGKVLQTKYVKDIHLDSKAINIFSKAYEKGLYHPQNSNKDKIEPLKYEGKELEVYRIHDDFKMLARVEGAYNLGMESIENYKQYFNSPNISAHGNCESIIGQDQIGLARNAGGNIVIGYNSLLRNSLLIAAPYDLNSRTANKTLSPLNNYYKGDNIVFYDLQEMIDNTRHTHNETVSDRVVVDENGKVMKLTPDYLIWVEDRKTDKFPPEFEVPAEEDKDAIGEYKAQVHLWEETQKASSQLGIPIVIINREECAEREMAKIEEMKKMLKGEIELPKDKTFEQVASEIVTKFENNAVGLQFAKEDVRKKYFTQSQREEIINILKNKTKELPKDAYQEKYEHLKTLKRIMLQEHSKYIVNAAIRANKEVEDFYDFHVKSVQDELLSYEQYIGIKNDIDFNIDEEKKDVFEKDIRSIAQTNYYAGNKAHSIEHIEKVMLFSLMIAKNEGIEGKDLNNLLAAAAFHDSYRNGNDGNSEHAEGSAKVAKNYFEKNEKNSYNVEKNDIPLIQVAIEYHEYMEPIKGKADKEQISKLCEKYGYKGDFEKVVQISTILKDADALDRERFATRGKLDSRYLHTDSAKSAQMISLARKINGRYAKQMIEKNYEDEEKVDELQAVKILGDKRINNNDLVEKNLSSDEMLELFNKVIDEQTKELSDVEKKKNILKVFEEVKLTKEDEMIAKRLLGIEENVKKNENIK